MRLNLTQRKVTVAYIYIFYDFTTENKQLHELNF